MTANIDEDNLSAAAIVEAVRQLVAVHKFGLDVEEEICNALTALNATPCQSMADALAFISFSRQLTQSVVQTLANGCQPNDHIVEACDRYMETALDYLRHDEARAWYRDMGFTLH